MINKNIKSLTEGTQDILNKTCKWLIFSRVTGKGFSVTIRFDIDFASMLHLWV